uniref:GIY-YIG endonuclease n=1 Tax=Hirsutella rhossiliensis TaxID=111463 RepID=A0A3G4R799_9HYPO|nr:GIY-YIG endonuclease [Hirsutella rhossiliensis]
MYEYFSYESRIISDNALTTLEISYIKAFSFNNLYNFKYEASSMLNYKHTDEVKIKMIERLKNKNNHPMYGKNHSTVALGLISKPGILNPMYGKNYSKEIK